MNIKSRIKKLEYRIIRNVSFCECFDNYLTKFLDAIYNDAPIKETGAAMLDGDACQQCNKPSNQLTRDLCQSLVEIYGKNNELEKPNKTN